MQPLIQLLRLEVDLERRHVAGVCTIWLFSPSASTGEEVQYRLHARQMDIRSVKVNGADATFEYPYPLDLLKVILLGVMREEARAGWYLPAAWPVFM